MKKENTVNTQAIVQTIGALSDERVMIPGNLTDGVAEVKGMLRKLLSGEWVLVDAKQQAEAEHRARAEMMDKPQEPEHVEVEH